MDARHDESRPRKETDEMAIASEFDIEVEQIDGFEFRVKFDKAQFSELRLDEPPPLGHDSAPNASRVLAAAVGNCLAASLVFCSKRAGVVLSGVRAKVHTELVRNADKRLRIGRIDVVLSVPEGSASQGELAACASKFEDFCVVTQSVRAGIDVQVAVETSSPGGSERIDVG
jgi:organic hydroperoxide reductase OsmC/OhrA